MAVRDPAFWRRFSVAVHQDEEANRPDLKHSYVLSSSALPPSPDTPVSPYPPTPVSPNFTTHNLDTKPSHHVYPPASSYSASAPNLSHPTRPKPARLSSFQSRNRSLLSLNLTGRPASRIKFWTTINADHRASWLDRQRQKESRRTCMCWVFWLCLIAVVTGAVVAVLYLKGRGII